MYLLELHIISILKFVPLIFVNGHNGRICLSYTYYYERFSLFSILISNSKFISIVQKYKSMWAIGVSQDEAYILRPAEFILSNDCIYIVKDFSHTDNIVSSKILMICCKFVYCGDCYIRVEFFKLSNASFSSWYFAYIFLPAVKVTGEISPLDNGWIVKCHWLRAS
jgi:hypothetical protein